MAERKDILLRDDDLSIVEGDFEIGASDAQHAYHIILNPKGSYKQFPLTGVGKAKFIGAPYDQGPLRREVQLQLESDGYRLNQLKISDNGDFEIDFDLK